MTSTAISHEPTTRFPLGLAVATVVGTLAFTALGTFGDGSEGTPDPMEFLVIAGFILALAAVMFLVVVPRSLASGRTAGLGLGLSIAALPFVLAFWAGITPVLAVSGIVLGAAARRSGRGGGKGGVAIALGALALVGYVAIYVSDWMATNNIAGM